MTENLERTHIPTYRKMNTQSVPYALKNKPKTAHALTWGKKISATVLTGRSHS